MDYDHYGHVVDPIAAELSRWAEGGRWGPVAPEAYWHRVTWAHAWFDATGCLNESKLSQDCIDDCSAGGDVSEAVEFWVRELDFRVPQALARKALEGYGAWDDLQTVDDETLKQRVLWLACCDVSEAQTRDEAPLFCLE